MAQAQFLNSGGKTSSRNSLSPLDIHNAHLSGSERAGWVRFQGGKRSFNVSFFFLYPLKGTKLLQMNPHTNKTEVACCVEVAPSSPDAQRHTEGRGTSMQESLCNLSHLPHTSALSPTAWSCLHKSQACLMCSAQNAHRIRLSCDGAHPSPAQAVALNAAREVCNWWKTLVLQLRGG